MKVLMLMCIVVAAVNGGVIPSSYVEHESFGNSLGGYESGYGAALSVHAHEDALIGPHGEPLDTDEVAQAKAVHFAEVAKAKLRLHKGASHDEQPIDTPEVQVAKFQHQLAHHEAHQRLANPELAHAAGPVDTAEVQIARHEHQEAHAEAELRAHHPAFAHAALPVDTYEVQKAKVEHFAAHAAAQLHAHQAPQDTAEVQLANFQHQIDQQQHQVQALTHENDQLAYGYAGHDDEHHW